MEARSWSDARNGHEPMNAGGLQKLENSPLVSPEETRPAATLALVQTSDL